MGLINLPAVEYDIIPPSLAIRAMKDNGYRNMAYGIAELVDNSIQAGSKNVRIIIMEDEVPLVQRTRTRAVQIAVVDDGCGMTIEGLQSALQFGNGSRLNDRSGIGRFGVGLPNSSINFCEHLQVWSWQHGAASNMAQLDVPAVMRGEIRHIAAPTQKPVPDAWKRVIGTPGESGTIVIWDRLLPEACTWRKAEAIIRHSEGLLGRIYRRFLEDGKVSISMETFSKQAPQGLTNQACRPNDPLYLSKGTSTPAPWNIDPMFEDWGEPIDVTAPTSTGPSVIRIRFSMAKDAARNPTDGLDPGNKDYGKHAAKNVGVSLVRAGRELELDQSLVNDDPTERWWGCEIEFQPDMDENFGVTNNKQSARHFSDLVGQYGKQLGTSNVVAFNALKEEFKKDNDPQLVVVEVIHQVKLVLATIRKQLKAQTRSKRARELPGAGTAEQQATKATEGRIQSGFEGRSDDLRGLTDSQRVEIATKEFDDAGLDHSFSVQTALDLVQARRRYQFTRIPLQSAAFFAVHSMAGLIHIKLNSDHPAFQNLVAVLEDELGDAPPVEELANRLTRAREGLKLLLCSWARLEDEALVQEERERLEDIRTEWSKLAKQFLRNPDS